MVDGIHIFEPGGRGGVFQHALEAAQVLANSGRIVLHTATDHEGPDLPGVQYCLCMDWLRDVTMARSPLVASRFVARTLPHLLLGSRSALWVQGGFKLPITFVLLVLTRISRRRVIFSPHNIFVRSGGMVANIQLRACMRVASHVVVYNAHDRRTLHRRHIEATQLPLIMYAPPIPEELMAAWQRRLGDAGVEVACIGQLRDDKNLPFLVRVTRAAGVGLILAGRDHGALSSVMTAIAETPGSSVVLVEEGYLDLEVMAAIIANVRVVALPYLVASQSAVASLAVAYGTRVVAMDVGGLAEAADVVMPELDVDAWARQIQTECARTSPTRLAHPLAANTETADAYRAVVRGL